MKLGPFEINLRTPTIVKDPIPEVMPQEDEVWAEEDSQFWKGINGAKYNPDALIGKKGYGIYRKMMLDEQVKAVTRFKRDAITSRDYYFEPHEGLSDAENDKRIKVSDAYLDQMEGSFLDAINGLMSAMYQGFAIADKVFKIIEVDGKAYWGIRRIPIKPYDTFEFVTDDFGNTTELWQELNGKRQKIDMSKVIHHLHNPEYDAQYGQSELREAYRPYFHKEMTIRFYGMWLERHASGFKVVTPREGKTIAPQSQEYTSIQNALSNAVNGASILLTSNVDFQIYWPSNNVAFKEAIQEDNLAIAKALLVPNLMGITPAGQTGSYSQSDTQLEAFLWTLNADAARLEDTLNEQLFRELGRINFGDDNMWPRFKFKPVSEKKKMDMINVWKDLVSSKAVTASDTDEQHIRELMNFPEVGEKINEPVPVVDPSQGGGDPVNNPTDDLNDDSNVGDDKKVKPDETIQGKLAQIAMSRAQKRVDFNVIERASMQLEAEHSDIIAKQVTEMVNNAVAKFKEVGGDATIDFGKREKTRLNKMVSKALKDGWDLGQKHSQVELDKAKGAFFSRDNIDGKRLAFISEEYFQERAFRAAGKLTDDAQALINETILNGIKFEKTVDQIEKDIYEAFARKGMITEEQAKDALGDAMLGLAEPQARINTMIRTNLFEAVNEARYNYFTDPVLDGFVQALEYSAVMDNRTTQICQNLDGHIHPTDSDFWNVNRPPNHFNCRSILIPVTEIDEWKESDPLPKDVKPATGFY